MWLKVQVDAGLNGHVEGCRNFLPNSPIIESWEMIIFNPKRWIQTPFKAVALKIIK